ncbi:MAG TPA: hypothetical protein VGR20_21320 [Acidimicrobiia bacterium]|nr:hypothetical protein [Acidimicrobiia bacterium]
MHSNEPVTASATHAFRRTPVLIAGVVVASFFLAGLGVAFAQTGSPTTDPTVPGSPVPPPAGQIVPAPAPAQGSTPPADPGSTRHFGHGGHGGHGGPFGGKLFGFGGFGRFDGLHGEFTIRKPDGNGFQTAATQTGEVTAVSPSSITVKSEDGFSRTYSVDENTFVGSGRDGIGTVKTGDTVRIAGVVEDGKAKAAAVLDSTNLGKLGEHWGFPKRK